MPYVNKTGLPSVTDGLKTYINTEWMNEESRERGSAVHSACFAHITGAYVVPLRPSWSGYFDSFRRWCDTAKPQVELAEERLIDEKYGYCGQMDFIGTTELRDGRGLIDWKTSSSFEKWFRLQGAAYRNLAEKNGYKTEWGGNLRLKADGSMPLFDYWPENIYLDFSLFVYALNLYRFFK